MKLAKFGALFLLAILPVACSKKEETASTTKQKQPVTLESLDQRLTSTEVDVSLLQAVNQSYDPYNLPATISCTQTGADMAHTAMGAFPVACENVSPYLDGYKVKLRIDNITYAEYDGVDVHISYGDKFQLTDDETSTAVLRPGHSNYLTVTLSPAKSADVKAIMVNLKFSKWQVYK